MNPSERIERYKAFKAFSNNYAPKYEEISRADKKIQELNGYYSLCVCPGGSAGGSNDRLFEIFYGHRPFDSQRFDPFNRDRVKVLVEHGARLHYNLKDNGRVVAALYPAQTDHLSPIEDAILISENLDPKYLHKVFRAHFESLNAYMRCTSLDGEPSKVDVLRVFWLRLTRPLIIEKKKQQTRLWTHAASIFRFTMSVGLSGFLLAVVMAVTASPPRDYSAEINQASKTLISIDQKIEVLSNGLKEVREDRSQTASRNGVKK
uniref:Uncharacterized protein n=1 Tax=Curvibacter symbiont subsp. Hydra magnipapillata TaxID=667019 RepID=C9YBX2_CURXX|nr:hypothetical protein Csp_C22010 [Curvibacter putative symbiont of Hydra magnipapillata]